MLQSFNTATDEQLNELSTITSLPLMASIGQGQNWSIEKLKEMRDQEIEDTDLRNGAPRQYYQWLILADNIDRLVVGYLSLRPIASDKQNNKSHSNKNKGYGRGQGKGQTPGNHQEKRGLQVRIFTHPPGQGYGKKAIANLLTEFRGEIWSIVRIDNVPSNKLFGQWEVKGITTYGKLKHYNYYFDNRIKCFSPDKIPFVSLKRIKPVAFVPYIDCEIAIMTIGKFNAQLGQKKINYEIKHIVVSNNPSDEKLLAIVCPNFDKALEYLDCYNESPKFEDIGGNTTNSIGYTVCGFSGMRKYHFHKKMRNIPLAKEGYFVRREAHCKNYLPCYIKNNVQGVDNITDKSLLPIYDNLSRFLPQDYTREKALVALATNGSNNDQTILIIKPVGVNACAGSGISVVKNEEEFLAAEKLILSTWDNMVIQKYITNPLLFDGKKCHFRVHIFVSTWGKFSLFPEFEILTAKDIYPDQNKSTHFDSSNNLKSLPDLMDWSNKNIHDSHGKSTETDYFYPMHIDHFNYLDLGQLKAIDSTNHAFIAQGVEQIYEEVIKLLDPKPYEESKIGYEILGMDIMFTYDPANCENSLVVNNDLLVNNEKYWQPILIEVNNKLGFSPVGSYENPLWEAHEKRFLEWEFDCIKKKIGFA